MNPKKILLADDDMDDLELLEEAFLTADPDLLLSKVSSGREGLAYLKSCDDNMLPCLIVLDYNMPDISGAEVLAVILKDDRYKKIPSVIWSTSNTKLYKEISLQRGAKHYYQKPHNFQDIISLAQEMLLICEEH